VTELGGKSSAEYPALPVVAGDWLQHAFTPHVDRPQACIVCGRRRVWRWHFGPFLPARARPRVPAAG
jgi:hypothetical protein